MFLRKIGFLSIFSYPVLANPSPARNALPARKALADDDVIKALVAERKWKFKTWWELCWRAEV